jgi:hypothetical protein
MHDKSTPDFKASKDRRILLLGGYASGTLKSKPLMVYHSENSRVMKGILKSRLPVNMDFKQKGLDQATNFLRMVF